MSNCYKFNEDLCKLLNIDHTETHNINSIIDKLIDNMIKYGNKYKFNDILATHFKTTNWKTFTIPQLKALLMNNSIINVIDKNFLKKYVTIGYENSEINEIIVNIY